MDPSTPKPPERIRTLADDVADLLVRVAALEAELVSLKSEGK